MSAPPSKLGKYNIIRALGEGAMGTVYEAVDRVIERTVAIKTIRRSDLDAEEAAEHSRRFLIEAKAAGKLNHPNIISLYDHGDEAGMAYIVMELVQGRELQRYFDEKLAFSLADIVRLMGELLAALGYSHRRGVVHRDVKPANIFITDTGELKLGDFGIARIESSQRTRVGAVVGTPSYMAPEQIRGETADARSDLYAAGVVLYQFLTGERPYSGNMLAMALKVLNEPVPLASAINPEVSPQLDEVVSRALAKNADQRYQTAAEFWQALAGATGLVLPTAPPLAALSGAGLLAGDRGLHDGTGLGGVTGTGAVAAPPVFRTALPPPPAPPAPDAVPQRAPVPEVGSVDAAEPRPARPTRRAIGIAATAVIGLGLAAWWTAGRQPERTVTPAGAPATAPAPVPTVAPAPAPAPVAVTVDRPASAAAAASPASSLASIPSAPASVAAPVPVPTGTSSPRETAPTLAKPGPADTKPGGQRPPVREVRLAPAPRPAPTGYAPPVAAPTAQRSPRCSDILQKASLEPLSSEEAAFLRKECR